MNAELYEALQIDVKDRLANPLIESTIVRNFGVVAAIDDFSPSGKLVYTSAKVDGEDTDSLPTKPPSLSPQANGMSSLDTLQWLPRSLGYRIFFGCLTNSSFE